ncbi:MAG: hypothetical protein ACR2HJ_04490 [Fimbriimonadales bacterium]
MTQKAFIEAAKNPERAAALDPEDLGVLLNAFSAAAHETARSATIYIGPRCVRTIRGRPWIEMPQRVPLAARITAEAAGQYGHKGCTVSSPQQGWKVRVSAADGELRVFWLEGPGVVALDADTQVLGSCTPSAPSLSVPGITLPMNLTLRALGTLD